jgi:hypothetical protein
MDDEYKGEDRKGRVTYDKFKDVKKALKGPEYKNLLQQFMEMIQGSAKKPAKTTPKKTAVKRTQKSKIPPSPTR